MVEWNMHFKMWDVEKDNDSYLQHNLEPLSNKASFIKGL